MTLSDFIIIYLAIGAPFGVHYFLRHRAEKNKSASVFLRSVCIALAWIPRLFQLVTRYRRERFVPETDENAENERKISELQKSLCADFLSAVKNPSTKMTLFEYREVLERYAGLTQAAREADENADAAPHEGEIFRIGKQNDEELKISAQVVHRQNVFKLRRHQIAARADFMQTLDKFRFAEESSKEKITKSWQTALKLTQLLDDSEAERAVRKKIFALNSISEAGLINETEDTLHNQPTEIGSRKVSAGR